MRDSLLNELKLERNKCKSLEKKVSAGLNYVFESDLVVGFEKKLMHCCCFLISSQSAKKGTKSNWKVFLLKN